VDGVAVAPSDPGPGQVAGRLELAEDLSRGPFGDADQRRDVADPQLGIAGDAGEDVEVVRDERPAPLILHRLAAPILRT
jgi:hypothetical protein